MTEANSTSTVQHRTSPRLSASEVFFIIGTVATGRGGLTRTLLSRMRLYAESGIQVHLLLTLHSPHEEIEEAAIRTDWSLPESVQFHYFWRDAAPGGGGAPTDNSMHLPEEPGLTAFWDSSHGSAKSVRLHDNGILVKTKHYFEPSGQLYRIDWHDIARRTTAREYFSSDGFLVRIDNFNPDLGQPTLRRLFDRSGQCWLTSWLNKNGKPQATVQHRPTPVAYNNYEDRLAEWLEDVLARSNSPIIFSDDRDLDPSLLRLTHPNLRKVAIVHNGHTQKNCAADDPVKTTYIPLVNNVESFDKIVVLTDRQRAHISQRFNAENLVIINHPAPPKPQLNVTRNPNLLVAVSRLAGQKRLDHAIRAFAIAAEKLPHARFDIYGNGDQAGALKRLVADIGLQDRVRFLGYTDQAMKAFASGAASVLSSSFEGFGLVLTESMCVGTPFIAYDLNYGPAEVIRHEEDGVLVPYNDVDALGTAMVRLLGDSDYAESLGRRARDVTERFSIERWAQEWLDLYHSLATSGLTSDTGLAQQVYDAPSE